MLNIWVFTVCKRWQLVRLPELLLCPSGPSSIKMACQVLASLVVSRHYIKTRQNGPVCTSVGMSEWVLSWAHLLRFYSVAGAFLSFNSFLYPPLKSAGYYGIPSVQKFELSVRLSVCLSNRPSITISFLLSILSIFQPILFKLYIRVDSGEE